MMSGTISNASDQLAPQQQDIAMNGFNNIDPVDVRSQILKHTLISSNLALLQEPFVMPFNSDLNNPDILESFDFEQFLQTTDSDFNFDPSTFDPGDGIEMTGGS